jgi:UDP-3-O-[3-hydroxymyristoyl] glucosamine N-acyltransferase
MNLSARELATRLSLALEGDGDATLSGVADLESAGAGEITFVTSEKYAPALAASKASAAIVPSSLALPEPHPAAILRADDPNAAFIAACILFAPPPVEDPKGVHPLACVSPEATVAPSASVGAFAVVEAGASVGEGTVVRAHAYVGHGAKIGRDCLLYPTSVVREHCVLGDRVILQPGAIVGADGFGYMPDANGVRTKIPQTGIVVLEDDVELGAGACVDRARFGKTVVGHGTKIDNLVQVAHNCRIGHDSVLCAQVGLAGTTTIGHHVICAGQVGVAGHLTIGDGVIVGAQSGVAKSLPAGQMYLGSPAVPRLEFGRSLAHTASIPKLKEQVKALAARIASLESAVAAASASAPSAAE